MAIFARGAGGQAMTAPAAFELPSLEERRR